MAAWIRQTAIFLAALGVFSSSAAQASNGATAKPYWASYSETSAYGPQTRTVLWDGNGHGRNEVTRNGKTTVSIIDLPQHAICIMSPDAPAMHIPLREEDAQRMGLAVAEQVKDRVSLGTRLIENRLCKGERYTLGEFTTEAWTDLKLGCPVETKTSHPQLGTTCSRLTSLSDQPQSPQLFQMPTN